MLEIIFLFVLGKKIASIARDKNRNPAGYVLLLVFGWFILGFGFGIIGAILAMANGVNEDDAVIAFLPGYVLGAASAALLAFVVVGNVSRVRRGKRRRRADYDDYDDYDDRPVRRRRDEDDYDYGDRPRSRRRDDDDYDRPRRRRDEY